MAASSPIAYSPMDGHGHDVSGAAAAGVPMSRSPSQPTVAPALPLSPAQVLKYYAASLAPYEQGEILEYKRVYFLGTGGMHTPAISPAAKAAATANTRAPNNHGFDDAKGVYARLIPGDHIAYRYEIVSLLGEGSFGQVVAAFDHGDNSMVAVKLVRNKKRFRNQAMIELALLTTIRDSELRERQEAADALAGLRRPGPAVTSGDGRADAPLIRTDSVQTIDHHIIHVKDSFVFRNHVAFTFPMLSINLYELIKKNHFRGLSLNLIRRFAVQILDALCFLSTLNVVHCDLKPENILLRSPSKSAIDIIDLGSSCYENERIYTYIQSRFYRAPEVILQLPYGKPIDIWSFGCILAELLTGYPLFAGEDETDQLACQMEILGAPPAAFITPSPRKGKFFDEDTLVPFPVTNSRGKRREPGAKTLAGALKLQNLVSSSSGSSASDIQLFLSFLAACLRWDPATRITPAEAMRHPWIAPALPAARAPPLSLASSSGTVSSSLSPKAGDTRGFIREESKDQAMDSRGHGPSSFAKDDEARAAAAVMSSDGKPPPGSEPRRPPGVSQSQRPVKVSSSNAAAELSSIGAAIAGTGGTDNIAVRSSETLAADTGGDAGGSAAPRYEGAPTDTSAHLSSKVAPVKQPDSLGAGGPRGRGPAVHTSSTAPRHGYDVTEDGKDGSDVVAAAARRADKRLMAAPPGISHQTTGSSSSPRPRGYGHARSMDNADGGAAGPPSTMPIGSSGISAVVREARVEAAGASGDSTPVRTGDLQAWLRSQRRPAPMASQARPSPMDNVNASMDGGTGGPLDSTLRMRAVDDVDASGPAPAAAMGLGGLDAALAHAATAFNVEGSSAAPHTSKPELKPVAPGHHARGATLSTVRPRVRGTGLSPGGPARADGSSGPIGLLGRAGGAADGAIATGATGPLLLAEGSPLLPSSGGLVPPQGYSNAAGTRPRREVTHARGASLPPDAREDIRHAEETATEATPVASGWRFGLTLRGAQQHPAPVAARKR